MGSVNLRDNYYCNAMSMKEYSNELISGFTKIQVRSCPKIGFGLLKQNGFGLLKMIV